MIVKKLIPLFLCILISCSSDESSSYEITPSNYKNVDYVTITNESTGGGSQFFYLKSGISESNVDSCYCDDGCSKEIIVVSELQFDNQSMNFRYKISLTDNYTVRSTSDWCTKFN